MTVDCLHSVSGYLPADSHHLQIQHQHVSTYGWCVCELCVVNHSVFLSERLEWLHVNVVIAVGFVGVSVLLTAANLCM